MSAPEEEKESQDDAGTNCKLHFTPPLSPLGDCFVSRSYMLGTWWDGIDNEIKYLESNGPIGEVNLLHIYDLPNDHGLSRRHDPTGDVQFQLLYPKFQQHRNTIRKMNLVVGDERSPTKTLNLQLDLATECVNLMDLSIDWCKAPRHKNMERLEKYLCCKTTKLDNFQISVHGDHVEDISMVLSRSLVLNKSIRCIDLVTSTLGGHETVVDNLHHMLSKLKDFTGLKKLRISFYDTSSKFWKALNRGIQGNSTLDDLILQNPNLEVRYSRTGAGLQLTKDQGAEPPMGSNNSYCTKERLQKLASGNYSLWGVNIFCDPTLLKGHEKDTTKGTIKNLTLQSHRCDSCDGIKPITSMLRRLRGLTKLDLSNSLSFKREQPLCQSLQHCSSLEYLSLDRCWLGVQGCINVYKALAVDNTCTNLRCLRMGRNICTSQYAQDASIVSEPLLRMLDKTKKSFTSLELDDFGFDQWGAALFMHQNIKEFALQECSDQTLVQLGTALESNSTMLSLTIGKSQFDCTSIRDFFLHLPKMTGLRYIHGLSVKRDTCRLIDVLANAISNNSSLCDITRVYQDENFLTYYSLVDFSHEYRNYPNYSISPLKDFGGDSHSMVWLYLHMNRRGRYLLRNDDTNNQTLQVPAGIWPLILSRMTMSSLTQDRDCLFYFLRNKPDLFPS